MTGLLFNLYFLADMLLIHELKSHIVTKLHRIHDYENPAGDMDPVEQLRVVFEHTSDGDELKTHILGKMKGSVLTFTRDQQFVEYLKGNPEVMYAVLLGGYG